MNTRSFFSCCLVTAFTLLTADAVTAQNNSREFIESSSPLSDGSRVISRSEPGRDVQTVITVSSTSAARNSGQTASSQANRDRIDLTSQREQADASRSTDSSPASAQSVMDRYPYPANSRIASNSLLRTDVANNRQTAYQLPTLGIGSVTTARRAQFYQDCNCNPQTFGAGRAFVPATQAPSLQVQPPALTIQDPGQVGAGFQQSVVQQPYFNTPQPQFGFQNNNRWWNPIVTGSGVYQPIVRLANVKPGTYLGQGIIGQPTAYVDGQPLRNLLRYISP